MKSVVQAFDLVESLADQGFGGQVAGIKPIAPIHRRTHRHANASEAFYCAIESGSHPAQTGVIRQISRRVSTLFRSVGTALRMEIGYHPLLKPCPSIPFDVPVAGPSWNLMNPFNVLEIPTDASPEDIKGAYHRLAKRWHPDRYSGAEKVEAEAKFRELAEAFSILKDPAKRFALQQQLPKPGPRPVEQQEIESPQERTPEDWAAMAKAAFDEGNVDQARALIHYAIRLDDEKPQYHALLAAILEKEGSDLRAVVKALETAVRLAPRDVDSHIRLATHFQTLGMAARAQRHLQVARELAPNHPKLRIHAPKAGKGSKGSAVLSAKGKASAAPAGLLDQLKDLWGRLTGKG